VDRKTARSAAERDDAQPARRATHHQGLDRSESFVLALHHSIGNRALARVIEQARQAPPARRILARFNLWKYLFDSAYRHRYKSDRADRQADQVHAEIDEMSRRIRHERDRLEDPERQLDSLQDRRPRGRAEAEARARSLETRKDQLDRRFDELLGEMRRQAGRDLDATGDQEITRGPVLFPWDPGY
jgi:chromosome segregation ATPase